MKKKYNNVIKVGLGSLLLCLGLALPASAQRGAEHSDGQSSGGSAPAPAPQRSTPAPAPQPQMQRSAPAPAPQPRSYAPQQQQQQPPQQQVQRGSAQAQPQNNPYSRQPQRTTNGVVATPSVPRGAEHSDQYRFSPARPGSIGGIRRYPTIGQRGYTYSPRSGNVAYGRSGYRSYPGLPFGRNYITARPRGFYYNNRGSYRTYYTPQLGFSLRVLPNGYYPFYFGADQYYYNDGLYYRQENDNYTVVEPPIGAAIDKLPAKAQPISINGMQYYELNGVYYQPITKDDGTLAYQIAGKDGELTTADNGSTQDDLPQVGDLVDNLPEGCKALKLNGQKFYVSQEGYYFQDAVDTNGDKVFKIVGIPTQE